MAVMTILDQNIMAWNDNPDQNIMARNDNPSLEHHGLE